jgi:putative DNA primase/helicase
VIPSKKTAGSIEGGAIRLQEPTDSLVIGEGIETSASAGVLCGLPAWAAVSAGNLPRIALPPTVRRVVIACDHDEPGKRAAQAAARRWAREGREVRIKLPNQEHEDFNDILLRERRHHG